MRRQIVGIERERGKQGLPGHLRPPQAQQRGAVQRVRARIGVHQFQRSQRLRRSMKRVTLLQINPRQTDACFGVIPGQLQNLEVAVSWPRCTPPA